MLMLKEHEAFTMLQHGYYDIAELREHILKYSDEWKIDTSRQELHKIHKDTETYLLQDFDLNWEISDGYHPVVLADDPVFWKHVGPIVKEMELKHDGKAGRVLIVRLVNEGDIPVHRDYGTYLELSRRHHLPIVTSENVTFSVQDHSVNMKEGELWEINNAKDHSVNNSGPSQRIHLIFDIIPNRYIES